jgi:hypothetical protein
VDVKGRRSYEKEERVFENNKNGILEMERIYSKNVERLSAGKQKLSKYLRKISNTTVNITCSGIHDKPNFQLCPERKGFASKGVLNIYQMDRPQAKTTLTVMFTFSANGDITPSMITCLNR